MQKSFFLVNGSGNAVVFCLYTYFSILFKDFRCAFSLYTLQEVHFCI